MVFVGYVVAREEPVGIVTVTLYVVTCKGPVGAGMLAGPH